MGGAPYFKFRQWGRLTFVTSVLQLLKLIVAVATIRINTVSTKNNVGLHTVMWYSIVHDILG